MTIMTSRCLCFFLLADFHYLPWHLFSSGFSSFFLPSNRITGVLILAEGVTPTEGDD